MIHHNKNFIKVNKNGMFVLSLGSMHKQKVIDQNNNSLTVHSLESYSHLKVDTQNYLLFECHRPGERTICVQQEFFKKTPDGGGQSTFKNLYKVRMHEMTLRELLLFSSLYLSKTLAQIVDVVND